MVQAMPDWLMKFAGNAVFNRHFYPENISFDKDIAL
jgi:hypothetical protein